ncbi:unnamed protein product [Nippostrongylus brasiliensis]|uniref:Protein kinase domain-containing protein n=1 Tax=Nippostrongylus brasiliensis TaxID=27835 RepID=A0A158R2X6_NIPBR|nr:unnamed protein product [Nippostrongylus brasiliensis]
MFLHSKDVVHGCLDFSSVVLDRHLNAKTIISASIHRTKSSRAACRGKVDDVFHNGDLVSAPSKYMRISEKGMKLVEYMFATNLRFPPTIGRVRYNDWIEECDENPPVFIMFPH